MKTIALITKDSELINNFANAMVDTEFAIRFFPDISSLKKITGSYFGDLSEFDFLISDSINIAELNFMYMNAMLLFSRIIGIGEWPYYTDIETNKKRPFELEVIGVIENVEHPEIIRARFDAIVRKIS